MKNKFLYLYYLVLILVLILYVNTSGSPSMVIRLGYLAALVAPLLKNNALYPAVILCALCISKNTFAYPFMPTEMFFYIFISLGFAFLSFSKQSTRISVLFLIVLSYIGLNDLILQGSFTPMVTMILLMILLFFCSEGHIDISNKFFPFTFIFLSLAISYWILFCPEARINTYNAVEEMEQAGWRDPNYIGCALGTGLVVAVREILQEGKNRVYTFFLLLTIVLSSFGLLAIASRGMTLAVSGSVGVMMIFSKVKRRTKILTILGLMILIVFLYTNQYFDFLLARFVSDDGTAGQRTIIWGNKLRAFFGESGFFNYLFGYGQFEGFRLGYNTAVSTHNDYISILIYYGFLGIFLFFIAFAYPLRICSNRMKPQIAALLLYLLICSVSIEPLASGNIAYFGFFFYITQLARQSQKK